MRQRKVLAIEIELEETVEQTDAVARLTLGRDEFEGRGHAQRNPADPDVPKIGEELATARALVDLANAMVDRVEAGIEAFEGHEVHVRL